MSSFPEVFDSSMMADLKACPQLWNLAHRNDWKGKGTNTHLLAGGAFAAGCEATRREFYIEGKSAEESIAIGLKELINKYGDFTPPTTGSAANKTIERVAAAFLYYWDHYPLSHDLAPLVLPGGKRGIEFSFTHPLPILHPLTGNPIIYAGRLDAIMNFAGAAWGYDEKTTSQLGSSWGSKWDLRGQFIGYAWGTREAGIPIKGIIVRGVSILKTKCETQESINIYPDWQIDRWYGELLGWIEDAITWWKRNEYRHNFDETCTAYGGCQFKTVCASMDKQPYLETLFEQRHWDPITRTETPLPTICEDPDCENTEVHTHV
jgi:hypothetical protein